MLLLQELAAAGEQSDAPRLRQLMIEASALDLAVPPSVRALLDELEVEERTQKAFTSTSTVKSRVAGGRLREAGSHASETAPA
ncbi:unnamed protein product [Effrenium voratum]|uniref:Uncharacterized protein n=1 Tax=Effrenium voratum TaxID=2562239 RepID=A0AA36N3F9_9DINO|nr:unnamed protein product [Effrenium voratum]